MDPSGNFSLVEMSVTVGIVGIMAATALPSYSSYLMRARGARDASNVAAGNPHAADAIQSILRDLGSFGDVTTGTANVPSYYTDALKAGLQQRACDVFVFGSREQHSNGPVRLATEEIAIYGLNGEGAYSAVIVAGGAQVGTLETYVAAFQGYEVTSQGHSEGIQLYEAGLGAEVPFVAGLGGGAGAWITEHDEGTYLFLSGDFLTHGDSLGFGWSSGCLAEFTDPMFH